MSAERPAAGGSEPAPADNSVPAEPEVAAPADAEPTLAEHTIEHDPDRMVWTMVGIGVACLVAILVFICRTASGVASGPDGGRTLQLVWRCCSPRCWVRCWCWWRVRPGCCSYAWSHGAIAAPTRNREGSAAEPPARS